jgi:hypothetical protein
MVWMEPTMKRLLRPLGTCLGILAFVAISPLAQARDITASGCTQAAVQTAINSAVDGDVVIVPSGSCTWTSSVRVSGKGIHLRGQQKGTVNITHSAGSSNLIDVTTDSTHSVEISNFNFLPGNASNSAEYIGLSGSGRPGLVHDNYFRTVEFTVNCIRWTAKSGVIWANVFETLERNGSSGGCLLIKPDTASAVSWSTASTMGTADITGTSNVYVEGNTFKKILVQAIDVDDDMRAVIRYNTFDNSGFVYHGADTGLTGARHVEVYNNKFIFTTSGSDYNYPLPLNWWVYMRGGTGVWTDNEMPPIQSQMWGNKGEITMTVQVLRRNSGQYGCWKTYPAPHQVGQSHNGQSLFTEPVYIWNNTGGGDQNPDLSDYSPDQCGGGPSVSSFIQAGRDYVVGVAKPGYTKYPYPHPLTVPGASNSPGTPLPPPAGLIAR